MEDTQAEDWDRYTPDLHMLKNPGLIGVKPTKISNFKQFFIFRF